MYSREAASCSRLTAMCKSPCGNKTDGASGRSEAHSPSASRPSPPRPRPRPPRGRARPRVAQRRRRHWPTPPCGGPPLSPTTGPGKALPGIARRRTHLQRDGGEGRHGHGRGGGDNGQRVLQRPSPALLLLGLKVAGCVQRRCRAQVVCVLLLVWVMRSANSEAGGGGDVVALLYEVGGPPAEREGRNLGMSTSQQREPATTCKVCSCRRRHQATLVLILADGCLHLHHHNADVQAAMRHWHARRLRPQPPPPHGRLPPVVAALHVSACSAVRRRPAAARLPSPRLLLRRPHDSLPPRPRWRGGGQPARR